MKFELVIAYYKRPKIVQHALNSILESNNQNYHLTLIDDSGNDDFRETFLNYGFDKDKITYTPIMMPDEEKVRIGGSIFGKYINDVIQNSTSDIFILICDDDALLPTYLDDLDRFFTENPNENWVYSHVKFFNPETQHYSEAVERLNNYALNITNINAKTGRINPAYNVDSSQVAFKIEAMKKHGVYYAFPLTMNLDAAIFNKGFRVLGDCPYMGGFGQYKGWFEEQLGPRFRRERKIYYK